MTHPVARRLRRLDLPGLVASGDGARPDVVADLERAYDLASLNAPAWSLCPMRCARAVGRMAWNSWYRPPARASSPLPYGGAKTFGATSNAAAPAREAAKVRPQAELVADAVRIARKA